MEIAECSGMPFSNLAKLVKKLVDAVILASKRGYRGGARRARDPSRVSLFELSEATDGPHGLHRCLLGLGDCSDEGNGPTHPFWTVERERLRHVLQESSLAGLIKRELCIESLSSPNPEALSARSERKRHV